jgi:hypothetical protein
MQIIDKEKLLEMIRADGAEDWKAVANALEDGEYLKSIGVEDIDVPAVEDAYAHADRMAMTHPDYVF